MTKQEFLNELQRTLTNKISSSAVNEHVNFYREYIEVEVRKGKGEEAVVEELGSPRLIAKSILTAASSEAEQGSVESDFDGNGEFQSSGTKWYRTVPGAVTLIILLIVILLAVVLLASVIKLFLPIILPVVLIILLVKIWKKYS